MKGNTNMYDDSIITKYILRKYVAESEKPTLENFFDNKSHRFELNFDFFKEDEAVEELMKQQNRIIAVDTPSGTMYTLELWELEEQNLALEFVGEEGQEDNEDLYEFRWIDSQFHHLVWSFDEIYYRIKEYLDNNCNFIDLLILEEIVYDHLLDYSYESSYIETFNEILNKLQAKGNFFKLNEKYFFTMLRDQYAIDEMIKKIEVSKYSSHVEEMNHFDIIDYTTIMKSKEFLLELVQKKRFFGWGLHDWARIYEIDKYRDLSDIYFCLLKME